MVGLDLHHIGMKKGPSVRLLQRLRNSRSQPLINTHTQSGQRSRYLSPVMYDDYSRRSTITEDYAYSESEYDDHDLDASGEPLANDAASDYIPNSARPLLSKPQDNSQPYDEPPSPRPAGVDLYNPYPNPAHQGMTLAIETSTALQSRYAYDQASTSSTATTPREKSSSDSVHSYETNASSVHTLPPLQAKSALEETDRLEPVVEDDPGSFELVQPNEPQSRSFSLEKRSAEMFSREHLQEIFAEPGLLLKFSGFLSSSRPSSIPLLLYYLEALKAMKAISYANAITKGLVPIPGQEFTSNVTASTVNEALEAKARDAFDALVRDDLPAFIAHTFTDVVSLSLQRRVTGTLPPHLREASEGLAEVFCLTDPSRKDNPIVFASEEFHRTTQYGVDYAIGRNCRFLQGPQTDKHSITRLRLAIEAGKEVCEIFLNYRRDGSPFMNLLMVAPLFDLRGKVRYFIGAQVDVSGLCKECSGLQGLQRLLEKRDHTPIEFEESLEDEQEDDEEQKAFQELTEMFNSTELGMIRRSGGKMHNEQIDEHDDHQSIQRPRLLLKDSSSSPPLRASGMNTKASGKLSGIYQNYLLVRPSPSLRVLFASPALRVPGILQSPLLSRIGGSLRVREELAAALAEGRGVTAKVRWLSSRHEKDEGRTRWIHCTPLLGKNGAVGVWMIVIVDEEGSAPVRRFKLAPPVPIDINSKRTEIKESADVIEVEQGPMRNPTSPSDYAGSITSFAL